MGVPAFFRWLTRKYPSVICECVEEKAREYNGKKLPVNTTLPNPNGVEFDNLYLDMNGIIHPCTHPEDRPAPKNEDEMMVAIFEFIDKMFAIVRPRKLLYMAIDGVAPRAKMNQQRSRRFRAAKESYEKKEEMDRIREELQGRGAHVPEKNKEEHFDSNCITPGTPFMHRLARCLKYYVHDRLRNDPGWRNIMVILSDANVPGEGEHKIMDYIRRQRAKPDHDPNTHHVLCGADADLIMLGLATHEPYFTIIREEFKPNKPRPCDICGQLGHEMKDCQGAERVKSGENDEIAPTMVPEQQYIFVRLYVLREYLARELAMPNLPFPYDLERAIDDWVFMCFFVGNDFLPHLPSLEIREGAIDRLVRLYKDTVYQTKGWLTDSGFVNLERVQMIMRELGQVEDEIFKKRQRDEIEFKKRQKAKKQRMGQNGGRPAWMLGGQFAPQAIGAGPVAAVSNAHREIHQTRVQSMQFRSVTNQANVDAAVALKAMLRTTTEVVEDRTSGRGEQTEEVADSKASPAKRKLDELDSDEEQLHDEVRLWEDGFKERYYESKFAVKATDEEFRRQVAREYVKGLCWVLQYYYQGCPSWNWYFPYHYAPFASDFEDIAVVKSTFEPGTKPFSPLEQLMGVFPAASGSHIPSPWVELMTDPESPIIDFYPEDFKIDLNGKKYAWQGVALLPFVDEIRLKLALTSYYSRLTEEEVERNTMGEEYLYVSKHHPGYAFLRGLFEGSSDPGQTFQLTPNLFHGVSGDVLLAKECVEPGGTMTSPIRGLPDLFDCHVVCVYFRNPEYPVKYKFRAVRLSGAKEPDAVLRPRDYDDRSQGPWRPVIGMAQSQQRGFMGDAGHRMLGHNMQRPPRPYGAEIHYSYQQQNSYQHRGGYQGGRGPPRQSYQGQSHHGGGHRGSYNNQPQQNRGYGPPPDSNGRYGNDYRPRQSGYDARPRQAPPRPNGPPNDNRNSGYGYYTSSYQGRRY